MKKLLILFAALAIVGCCKEQQEQILSPTEQQAENAKLVGTWQAIEESLLGTIEHYVFTEDFKMNLYYTKNSSEPSEGIIRTDIFVNEPYAIPATGRINITRSDWDYRSYIFKNGSLFITHMGIYGSQSFTLSKCEFIKIE